jgi:hypothetical protein
MRLALAAAAKSSSVAVEWDYRDRRLISLIVRSTGFLINYGALS